MRAPAIDSPSELQALLEELLERYTPLRDGAVATYIPELATADPDHFAIAVCSVSGDETAVGDAAHAFTIQSVCKPFLYATALERFGRTAVHRRVGVEPSGDAFNSVVRVESGTNRPHNPMINAGAIVVASLLCEEQPASAQANLLLTLGRWAGRNLAIDESVYRSEAATGDRNRAIAHLMHHLGMLDEPVEDAVDLYFRACSAAVTCCDLARMAGTLAAAGRDPVTGERVVTREVVRDVLAILSTCGMYDGTGQFAVEVGVPAKSGVSGAILAVVPGRLGLAVYSPRLDEKGNSVRGMAALRETATRRSLHLFDPTAPTPAAAPPIPIARVKNALDTVRTATGHGSGGAVASYIPELAAADPERFALAAVTVAGEVATVGNAEEAFTIQAAANPFGYALALAEHGEHGIHTKVGVEPSGNPYNAIEFDPATRRPHNPLSNAGAITIASLQPGRTSEDRWKRLAQAFAAMAGVSELPLDETVYVSEHRFGARNRAITYLLRNFGIIERVDEALDLYLRQCALRVKATQLAAMGALLAAGGRHPLTGQRLLDSDVVQRVLTVMYTCGMHDASGQFAFDVGLPGKSGISGAIVTVVPGQMGIVAFSPRVDERGASVRGFAALSQLSHHLNLGLFASPESAA